jgi:hypothetical protein
MGSQDTHGSGCARTGPPCGPDLCVRA